MAYTMTEATYALPEYKIPTTFEESFNRGHIILPSSLAWYDVQLRMGKYYDRIQQLHEDADKFIAFALGYGTEEQFAGMMDKATYVIKQLCMVEWCEHGGAVLKKEIRRMDAEAAAKAAAGKNGKGEKKPKPKYKDVVDYARSPLESTRESTPAAPPTRNSTPAAPPSVPQAQQAAPSQQMNGTLAQAGPVMSGGGPRTPMIPQPQMPQAGPVRGGGHQPLIAPQPQLPQARPTMRGGGGSQPPMTPQPRIPPAQQPYMHRMQNGAQLRHMAANTYQPHPVRSPQIATPQQLQNQQAFHQQRMAGNMQQMATPPQFYNRQAFPQQRMAGNMQQIATPQLSPAQHRPIPIPQQYQQQVLLWMQGKRGQLVPTPQQQQGVVKAQDLREHVSLYQSIAVRNPEQEQLLASCRAQYQQVFSRLCQSVHQSVSAMTVGNQPPTAPTVSRAHLPKKRSAPSDFETPSPTKKKMIVIGHSPEGDKVEFEDAGNGQVHCGGGLNIALEDVTRSLVAGGIILSSSSPMSQNAPRTPTSGANSGNLGSGGTPDEPLRID
jgi:hypothetical protein